MTTHTQKKQTNKSAPTRMQSDKAPTNILVLTRNDKSTAGQWCLWDRHTLYTVTQSKKENNLGQLGEKTWIRPLTT